MKHTLIFLCLFCIGMTQSQNPTCNESQAEVVSFLNEKEYDKANTILKDLLKACPKFSEKAYQLGIEIYQYNLEVATQDNKQNAVNDLVKLLDKYDVNFPNNNNGNSLKKAATLYANQLGSNEEIFFLYEKTFKKNKNLFNDANDIFTYFKLLQERFTNKNKNVTENDLIENYSQVLTLLDQKSKEFPEKSLDYKNATFATKGLLKNYLTPVNVLSYAEIGFEKNKSDKDWLLSTLELFSEKMYTENTFGKIALSLHQQFPTSKSAFYLGSYNLKNKKINEGVTFFEEAINLSQNNIEKAQLAYKTATVLSSSNIEKASKMIKSAIENDTKNGKYLIFLANLYANSIKECGANTEQSDAIYKLASQTVLKAGEIDANLKVTSEKMSQSYLNSIKNLNSRTIKIDCWINETVKL